MEAILRAQELDCCRRDVAAWVRMALAGDQQCLGELRLAEHYAHERGDAEKAALFTEALAHIARGDLR